MGEAHRSSGEKPSDWLGSCFSLKQFWWNISQSQTN
jgi:hypothetical protein